MKSLTHRCINSPRWFSRFLFSRFREKNSNPINRNYDDSLRKIFSMKYINISLSRDGALVPSTLRFFYFFFLNFILALQNRDVLGQGRVTYASGSDVCIFAGVERHADYHRRLCGRKITSDVYTRPENVTLNLYDFVQIGEMSDPRADATVKRFHRIT